MTNSRKISLTFCQAKKLCTEIVPLAQPSNTPELSAVGERSCTESDIVPLPDQNPIPNDYTCVVSKSKHEVFINLDNL